MRPGQLETVLRVRRHQRDQIRLAMAKILADGRLLDARTQQTDLERSEALQSLRSGLTGGAIDIDRISGLRYHAARLSIELANLKATAETHVQHVSAAQAMLTRADQGVKAVEKLQERHAAQQRLIDERRQDRDATDLYAANPDRRESRVSHGD